MTALEQAAVAAWKKWGGWAKRTECHACHEFTYCRSHNGTKFLCLGCFDQR